MDIDRFRRSPSGRIAQFGQGEAAYWAFLPDPLPPVLTWVASPNRRRMQVSRPDNCRICKKAGANVWLPLADQTCPFVWQISFLPAQSLLFRRRNRCCK